jgi:hypothetical protein
LDVKSAIKYDSDHRAYPSFELRGPPIYFHLSFTTFCVTTPSTSMK